MLLDSPEESDGVIAFQAYHDVKKYEQSFIVYANNLDESLAPDDYVVVDGKVEGEIEGENYFGSTLHLPFIVDATVKKSSYTEVASPVIEEVVSGATVEQNGLTITVDKIEYCDDETRFTLTVSNNTDSTISLGVYSMVLIVDGQQISQDSMSDTLYRDSNYHELDYEIYSGASVNGTVIFPAMEQREGYQLIIPDIYSDNYDVEYQDMYFDL